jgi:hypothetical protein
MRQWRVGTISMGLLLIAVGILMISGKIMGYEHIENIIKYWPVILILLGSEILANVYFSKDPQPKVKYDVLSIFFVIIILSASTVLYVVERLPNNFYFCSSSSVNQDISLRDTLKNYVSKNNTIKLQNITNFEWDTAYIFTPYSNPKQKLEDDDVNWERINDSIIFRDDIDLIVFVHDNNIVSYINYPRNYGDFNINTTTKFNQKTAIFNISKKQNIIMLEPKTYKT